MHINCLGFRHSTEWQDLKRSSSVSLINPLSCRSWTRNAVMDTSNIDWEVQRNIVDAEKLIRFKWEWKVSWCAWVNNSTSLWQKNVDSQDRVCRQFRGYKLPQNILKLVWKNSFSFFVVVVLFTTSCVQLGKHQVNMFQICIFCLQCNNDWKNTSSSIYCCILSPASFTCSVKRLLGWAGMKAVLRKPLNLASYRCDPMQQCLLICPNRKLLNTTQQPVWRRVEGSCKLAAD